MNIKKMFYSIRDECHEIDEIRMRLEELETEAEGVHSTDYSRDKVQTSPKRDAMGDVIVEKIYYQDELKRKLERLNRNRRHAQKLVNRLTDSRERQFMDLYFLSGKRRDIVEVAAEMGYTERQTYRIYTSAIASIETMYRNNAAKRKHKKCQ